ncbi:hypothetical protein POJ06DRAFT_259169 [Lipomyces tetrasporus]|uniref:Dynein light chain n=1 Tax=Lipomyces tetrasporus TaxID=54092 RepID=A0AAD7QNJ3_9ASCO|nr:uncharacterized protein POJ06DRAFT_259169 [Lipomyces tetrasporus]KAJ8098328.1 hypothetical protein POJ06DRAFT_259169 [Lipomyces tetrasporus]
MPDTAKDKPTANGSQWEGKAVIKSADMSEEMQSVVIDLAVQAMEKYNIEKVAVH